MQDELREVREAHDGKRGFHGAKEIPMMPSTMKKSMMIGMNGATTRWLHSTHALDDL